MGEEQEKAAGASKGFMGRIGQQIKSKPALFAGIAVGGGLVVFYLYKSSQAGAGATAAGASTGAGADSLNGYDVGSLAGIPYAYTDTTLPGSTGSSGSGAGTTAATGTGTDTGAGAGAVAPPSPAVNPKPLQSATTIKSGSLETTPHDVNGGKNLLTVPTGANVTYVSGPVPDPSGGSKRYYKVAYNGQSGFLGSDTLPAAPFGAAIGGGKISYDALHSHSWHNMGFHLGGENLV